MAINGQCSCKNVSFELKASPLSRVLCHCTICQSFNDADYGDVAIFRAKDVVMPEEDRVNYQAFTKPAIVHRGKCKACAKPAIEYVSLPLTPKLVIVPIASIQDPDLIPEASMHIFYHSRKNEIEDALPKYSGYLKSQMALGLVLIKGMFKA